MSSHKINYLLLPFSWLYGLVVLFRNYMFDWGWLTSQEFSVPVFCVGNISVGGTGKTPHTEYLVGVLSRNFKVAVLSRGYRRTTKGFVLLSLDHSAKEVGDEPCQMKLKFPATLIAVDSNRRNGIRKLLEIEPLLDVIILDDGFQHRYVKPNLSVILTDYNRMPSADCLLPAGRLREPLSHCKERAHIFVVTKTPLDQKPIERMLITKDLKSYAFQSVFFSHYRYVGLQPLFVRGLDFSRPLDTLTSDESILLVTGIANPDQLIADLSACRSDLQSLIFPDHHDFSRKDIKRIVDTFERIGNPNKMIVTTEKDAVRLRTNPFLPKELTSSIYILPIEVDIYHAEEFNKIFIDYVRKNRPNHTVSTRKSRPYS